MVDSYGQHTLDVTIIGLVKVGVEDVEDIRKGYFDLVDLLMSPRIEGKPHQLFFNSNVTLSPKAALQGRAFDG